MWTDRVSCSHNEVTPLRGDCPKQRRAALLVDSSSSSRQETAHGGWSAMGTGFSVRYREASVHLKPSQDDTGGTLAWNALEHSDQTGLRISVVLHELLTVAGQQQPEPRRVRGSRTEAVGKCVAASFWSKKMYRFFLRILWQDWQRNAPSNK